MYSRLSYLNKSQIAAHHSPLLFRVVQLPRVGLREKQRMGQDKSFKEQTEEEEYKNTVWMNV